MAATVKIECYADHPIAIPLGERVPRVQVGALKTLVFPQRGKDGPSVTEVSKDLWTAETKPLPVKAIGGDSVSVAPSISLAAWLAKGRNGGLHVR